MPSVRRRNHDERAGGDRALAFAERDPNDDAERMLTQIVNGVPKRDADTVYDDETSVLWDRISAGVCAISARGGIVVYGLGADD